MKFSDRFDILSAIRFSIGVVDLLFDRNDVNTLLTAGFGMKKKFNRLLNMKTAEGNSHRQTGLGEKTSRRSELAKKAIEALCNEQPVENAVIPIQEMKPASTILAMCECCEEDGIRRNTLVKIDSGQLICPTCLEAMRSFKS